VVQSIEWTGVGRDKRRYLALQDRAQSGENLRHVAATLDRRLAFCDIVPTQLFGQKPAGLRGFFPLSIAVHDSAGAIDDRDFRNDAISEIKLNILSQRRPTKISRTNRSE
jgi:hypothetical protein